MLILFASLAACSQPPSSAQLPEPERIALEDTGPPLPGAEAAPDSANARWSVAADGQAIDFGNAGDAPWLSLACDLSTDTSMMTVIRHADALPGEEALFPFVGNGMRSRFFADATLAEGEWRWEAILPAEDEQLDIFEGSRSMTATLPGHGMLEIPGSRIPGEFLAWCRSGGEVPEVVSEEKDEAKAAGEPAET
ncbi:MAG: hypothetical protein WBA68_13690 [Alteraurantiacibacter sp.]